MFDDEEFYRDEIFQRESAPKFHRWIEAITESELMKIITALEGAISAATRVGRNCHASVLSILEERMGFKMPYNSDAIAGAFEVELAKNGDVAMSGLESFVHLLQCPLRTLCGKMRGSRTGAYHERNEQLIVEGLYINRLTHFVAIEENVVNINLPKALIILDTTWFCPRIADPASRSNDEEGFCNPPNLGNDESNLIDAGKKHLLTVIQLILLKSAGCNITMIRASGTFAKNALKLGAEIIHSDTSVNFWTTTSELVVRSVSSSCRFVFTSHISAVLRKFPLVSHRLST